MEIKKEEFFIWKMHQRAKVTKKHITIHFILVSYFLFFKFEYIFCSIYFL